MGNRTTHISPREPGPMSTRGWRLRPGIADYGTQSRAEMIDQYRRYYQHELEAARYALSLTDDELIVQVFEGNRLIREVTDD